MALRVVRVVTGTGLLLVGLPALLAGAVLWFAMQHQDPTGGYSASLATITTEGYAVVSSDVDGLLRREAPFTRSERTTLRLTAQTDDRPAFIGLAPATDVARYLSGVPYTQIEQVRLARGELPVVTSPVAGDHPPAGLPDQQPFWVAQGDSGTLEWNPYEARDRKLALVVMDPTGTAAPSLDLTAQLYPQWLASTTFGLLVLGAVLVLVAVAVLAWPSRAREIVYVVPPAQVPDVAAHLGIPLPRPLSEPCQDSAEPRPASAAPVASSLAIAVPPAPKPDAAEGAEPGGPPEPEPPAAPVGEVPAPAPPAPPVDEVPAPAPSAALVDEVPAAAPAGEVPAAAPADDPPAAAPAEAPAAAPAEVPAQVPAQVPAGGCIAPRLEWPPLSTRQPTAPPVEPANH